MQDGYPHDNGRQHRGRIAGGCNTGNGGCGMRDVMDNILGLDGSASADTRRYRRQVIERLVWALVDITERQGSVYEPNHRALIMRLTIIIGDMTARISHADNAAFSTIIREAAMLVSLLQRRQPETAVFTVH